jgi:hypothetical protein
VPKKGADLKQQSGIHKLPASIAYKILHGISPFNKDPPYLFIPVTSVSIPIDLNGDKKQITKNGDAEEHQSEKVENSDLNDSESAAGVEKNDEKK